MLDKHEFIDRDRELGVLEEAYRSKGAGFLVIYGKRRVGKTELVKRFFLDKPHIYLLGDKRSGSDLLREFSAELGEYFGDVGVSIGGLPDWVAFFKYLGRKVGKRRIVIVVDEFPYLANGDRAIPSLFQKGWDEYLKDTNVLLILMGSSISMMERDVLAHKSPLYGRRTGQLLLHPMGFAESGEFFPRRSPKERVEFYSVLGGTPAYLLQFTDRKGLLDNILGRVLRTDAFLYNEVEFVLREEFNEPRQYFTILKEMAAGRTRVNEICQAAGLERNVLSRYLSILEELRIVKRDIPVTERHPNKSRKGLYGIDDNFFRFWFRFIFPHRSHIERDDPGFILEKIKRELSGFVGRAFEDICREHLWKLQRRGESPFAFTKVGRWWHREEEVDIVALNEETGDILLAECKWQDRTVGRGVLANLLKKSELVDWRRGDRRVHYALFSKAGFTKSCMEMCGEEGVLTFGLRDIVN